MIRQHDAAGADTDDLGASSDVADDNRRGCAGDAGHVVMFRQPKPFVTPDFRVLREIERVSQSGCGGRPLGNRREIEYRKRDHYDWMLCPSSRYGKRS